MAIRFMNFKSLDGPHANESDRHGGQCASHLKLERLAGGDQLQCPEHRRQRRDFSTVANVTTTSYTNSGLLNGTTYYYEVSALNSFSESANSTAVSAAPTNHPPVLAAIPSQTILAGRTCWSPIPPATPIFRRRP